MSLETIPLSALTLSPLNVRQVRDPDSVSDLVASIKHGSLLQNLCVTRTLRKKKEYVEVVAGGRRLLALQTLAATGDIPADFGVQCEVVDETRAIEVSLAENTQRQDMTPIEEYRAFSMLAEQGTSVEDIAAKFGVTPGVVHRRLKLMKVHPQLIDACENEDMDLEALAAFTLCDDQERQLEVWNTLEGYQRRAGYIKQALTDAKIGSTDPRVKFVGIDAYKAEGGAVTVDLFAGDEDGSYLHDEALLNRLFVEKLDREVAAPLRDQGWNVEVRDQISQEWQIREGFYLLSPAKRAFTEDEAATYAALEADQKRVEDELEAECESEDENINLIRKLEDDSEKIIDAIESMERACVDWRDEQKEASMAVVWLDQHYGPKSLLGLTTKKPKGEKVEGAGSIAKPTKFHSDRLALVLSCERTLAVQAALVRDHDVAWVAAVDALASGLINTYAYNAGQGTDIRVTQQVRESVDALPEAYACIDATFVQDAIAKWVEAFAMAKKKKKALTTFEWIEAMTGDDQRALMAVAVAASVNLRQSSDHSAKTTPLVKSLGVDMSTTWKPTAAGYFDFLTKPQILTVLKKNKIKMDGLDKMKKKDLAQKAEALMAEFAPGWVPKPLAG